MTSTTTNTSTPTTRMVPLNGTELCVHTWLPSSSAAPEGVVVLFHGFLAHGLYPTVRYAAELLVANGYVVVAADARGHGQSLGPKDYLPSREIVIQDGLAVTKYVQEKYTASKYFLVGSSMGGTIALSVAQALSRETNAAATTTTYTNNAIAGVVLLAPMLQLAVSAPARSLLWFLSHVIPTWSIIPSSGSANAELQYRDPVKRQQCVDATSKGDVTSDVDTNNDSGSKRTISVGSASTCVELASRVRDEFAAVTTPFLVLVADDDVVVNNQGALDLFAQSPLTEPDGKMLIRYPALHGLLCEPSPLIDTIQADLLAWIRARS